MEETKLIYEIALKSLEDLKNIIFKGELSDEYKIEFFETFKHDIDEMLEVKILKLRALI